MEQAAVRLLAQREHTRTELARKLGRRYPPELVEMVLADLASRQLQSDERFVEQYVAMRTRKGYGPLRIRAELRDKGIDEILSEGYLDDRDTVWRDLMQDVALRKYGSSAPANRQEMARRARFLEYRGFPTDMIRGYLFSD